MVISVELLQSKLNALVEKREGLRADLHAYDGAIQMLTHLVGLAKSTEGETECTESNTPQ